MTKDEIKILIREELQNGLFLPVGAIIAFPSENIPSGFLPCEGQELPIIQYPDLYAVLGKTFGGNEKTFFLPDLQGQFIRGLDREGNIDFCEDGNLRKIGSCQQDAFQGHNHSFDSSVLDTDSSGSHSHYLFWENMTFRDSSAFDSNNHKKLMPKMREFYDEYKDYSWHHFELKDGTERTGLHVHKIKTQNGATPVCEPISSSYGAVDKTVSTETRPMNIALIFCIKVI